MAGELAFRKMLVDIGSHLSQRDLQSLKYLCRDFIPRGRLEDIDDPQNFWDALEERGKLSVNNTTFLRALINGGCEGRVDLIEILTRFEQGMLPQCDAFVNTRVINQNQFNHGNNHPLGQNQAYNGLTVEMEYIVKNIGRDWRELARSLAISEPDLECISDSHPRDLKERIRQSLLLWQNNMKGRGSKHDLVRALQMCSRNDLAHGLEIDLRG